MDNQENRGGAPQEERDRQIQLVLNSASGEEDSIDLGNVFRNMKLKRRIYAWVLVLCLTVGLCAPLLLQQLTQSPLKVSSIVTLRYEVPENAEESDGLTAPDGSRLDVNQLTSAYVLQTALDSLELSVPLTAEILRSNLGITTILTDESRRTREALSGLAAAKSAQAYTQMMTAEMAYERRFIVTLTNGFGTEDSRRKMFLTDSELRQLLNQVLDAYNAYLVRTYADVKLPEDAFSVIDIEALDVPDALDEIRSGVTALEDYCSEKSSQVRGYRSWRTGRSLRDWQESLETFESLNIDYLDAMVSENAVTRDKETLLTSWRYLLRRAKNSLEEVTEKIAETKRIMAEYKNDSVYVSMQESDAAKTTTASTDYYRTLVSGQLANYDSMAKLKTQIADYEDRIAKLEATPETEITDAVREELNRCYASAQELYADLKAHMEELFQSPLYTTFADHSAAQGTQKGFLAQAGKKLILGAAAGLVIGFGLWFLAGLVPEFSKGKKSGKDEKEAAAK